MTAQRSSAPTDTVVVGVIADPVAAPTEVAQHLARDLPGLLSEQWEDSSWRVDVHRELPDSVAQTMMQKAGVDRLSALYLAIELVRRGGTISIIGVYGGEADPLPMLTLFDKQVTLRMGQANVKRWADDIMPLLSDGVDPLGVESFATHRLPLTEAPHGYDIFQRKEDNAVKVLLQP